MAMLLIRATKLCRKSIRKEGCLRCTRDDFGQNSDFGNSKRSKNPESKKCFADIQIDPLICFPQSGKKKETLALVALVKTRGSAWSTSATRTVLWHLNVPDSKRKKNLDYWQCPKKILACDVATSPGDFPNLSIHFCCLKSTPHESFLHPRTHPKNARWPVEIPSVQANFMQWNSICMNLPNINQRRWNFAKLSLQLRFRHYQTLADPGNKSCANLESFQLIIDSQFQQC